MLIRRALPADATALAVLGERLWRETYTGMIPAANLELHLAETFGPAQQARELMAPDHWALLLEREGTPLGYALLRGQGPGQAVPEAEFSRPLEVARFYLDQALHGTGAAQALMAAVCAEAFAAGHDGLWLQVWEQNPRAIRFYLKAGFHDAGDATFRIGHQVDRDRVMVRSLLPALL